MPLAGQPVHQRFVQPGPLVLGSTLLKSLTPTADRDRTVSRRTEPRSRTALMGEQPNPWDLLQPQDATSPHRTLIPRCRRRRLYLHPARVRARGRRIAVSIDLHVSGREHRLGTLRASVVTGSSSTRSSRLPTVLPSLIGASAPRRWAPPL